MACGELFKTQAFVDGELVGQEADAAERHIAGCTRCQAVCDGAAVLSDEMGRYAQRYAAPDRLRLRVYEALTAADAAELQVGAAPQVPANPATRRRTAWRCKIVTVLRSLKSGAYLGGFMGGLGVSGLAAALLTVALLPPAPDTLADRIVQAHTRALMSGGAIEVVSSDHHTVKPWFAGRINISPPVHDFGAEGFKLSGGRIDKVSGAPAAVLVYQHGLHKIDLFVWADRRQTLPGGATRRGYNTLCWKHHDLDFAAVSDMQSSELATFTNLVRSTQE
jgi:anti-sigma factor RsiW